MESSAQAALPNPGPLRRSPCIFSQGRNWPSRRLSINGARAWLLNPATWSFEIMGPACWRVWSGGAGDFALARLASSKLTQLSPSVSGSVRLSGSLRVVMLPYLPFLVEAHPWRWRARQLQRTGDWPERLALVQHSPWRPQLPLC
jgi:hypothetical protein